MSLQKLKKRKEGRRRNEGGRGGKRKEGYLLRTVPMKYMKSVFFVLIKILKLQKNYTDA